MKSFTVGLANLFTLASADCQDEASCTAVKTCSYDYAWQGSGYHCDVPGIRVACCDAMMAAADCPIPTAPYYNSTCQMEVMQYLPAGELEWWQSVANEKLSEMCPGLAGVMGESGQEFAEKYCRPAESGDGVATTGCQDEASCTAVETCSYGGTFQGDAYHCDMPGIRVACCDAMIAAAECPSDDYYGYDRNCQMNRMMLLPQGELDWWEVHGNDDLADMCPGIAAIMSQNYTEYFARHCSGVDGSTMLAMTAQMAILTAQHPKKAAQTSMMLPSVIGFAMGAAFVISVVVLNKKRAPADLYEPLTEATA